MFRWMRGRPSGSRTAHSDDDLTGHARFEDVVREEVQRATALFSTVFTGMSTSTTQESSTREGASARGYMSTDETPDAPETTTENGSDTSETLDMRRQEMLERDGRGEPREESSLRRSMQFLLSRGSEPRTEASEAPGDPPMTSMEQLEMEYLRVLREEARENPLDGDEADDEAGAYADEDDDDEDSDSDGGETEPIRTVTVHGPDNEEDNGRFIAEMLRLLSVRMQSDDIVRGTPQLARQFPTFDVEEGTVLAGVSQCPICLEPLSETVMLLPCLCVGHEQCLTESILADVRCPLHRLDVRAELQNPLATESTPGGSPNVSGSIPDTSIPSRSLDLYGNHGHSSSNMRQIPEHTSSVGPATSYSSDMSMGAIGRQLSMEIREIVASGTNSESHASVPFRRRESQRQPSRAGRPPRPQSSATRGGDTTFREIEENDADDTEVLQRRLSDDISRLLREG